MFKKIILGLVGLVALGLLGFGALQLIPYGKAHTNPPVVAEPQWDSAETRTLFMRACGDCHSNETTWPWYSNVAPISWLVQRDVDEGRQKLNISEWAGPSRRSTESAEKVSEGEMPPAIFLVTHPEAALTAAEKQALMQGMQASFGR